MIKVISVKLSPLPRLCFAHYLLNEGVWVLERLTHLVIETVSLDAAEISAHAMILSPLSNGTFRANW